MSRLACHIALTDKVNSRPCHIQPYNDSVPLPLCSSVLQASCAYTSVSSDCAKSFISSCELAQLVRRLQAEVCTVGGVAVTSASERRDQVVEIAQLADQIFDQWRDSVIGSAPRPTGVSESTEVVLSRRELTLPRASFLLQLLGFRCMLKRIYIELDVGLGAMFTPGYETLLPFAEFVAFIGSWNIQEIDNYWSHCESTSGEKAFANK